MAEVFYKYYKLYPSQKHYLFAKELCERIGLYSRKNKPHTRFFSDLYDSMSPEDEEKLYYHTHNGMVRAFSNWNTIFKIIDNLYELVEQNADAIQNMDGYKYIIGDMEYMVRIDLEKLKTVAYLLKRSRGEGNS